MPFTIPIEIIVDEEQVARERAFLESMGTYPGNDPKRKNDIRLPDLRTEVGRSGRVSKQRRREARRASRSRNPR